LLRYEREAIENSPTKTKGVEFHDELVAGTGDMNMHEEDSDTDTEKVNSLQGLGEILT
jgi:hypothetical protein